MVCCLLSDDVPQLHSTRDLQTILALCLFQFAQLIVPYPLRTYTHAARQAQNDAAQKVGAFMAQMM